MHPDNGIAVRMNVHGDNTTLHVHTNGTHAMALFDEDTILHERSILPTDGYHFKFGDIAGFKFQAHLISRPPKTEWRTDIKKFINVFDRSNLAPELIMSKAE